MIKSREERYKELLALDGFEVLAICDETSSAAESDWDGDPGTYSAGNILVRKDDKLGILFINDRDEISITIPVKYDLIFTFEGWDVSEYDDFFEDYFKYLGDFGNRISKSLIIFDSYYHGELVRSFVAEKFDRDFYYRDKKVFFLNKKRIPKCSPLTPYDDLERFTCEHNSDWHFSGSDNCYIAIKQHNKWSLYDDTFNDKDEIKCYLENFQCDKIEIFGYFNRGRYIIIKIEDKNRIGFYQKGEFKLLGIIADKIYHIGADSESHSDSAFVLKRGNKWAIMHPDGVTISQFIFDGVRGFVEPRVIQVVQKNGETPLYGLYSLEEGMISPCIYAEPFPYNYK